MNQKLWKKLRWFLVVIGFLLVWKMGTSLLGSDYSVFFRWNLTLVVLGVIFFPVTGLIFHKFHDMGWLFAKTIGVAVSGWFIWYLSSTILTFTRMNCIIVAGICLAVNLLLCFFMLRYAKKKELEVTPLFNSDQIFGAVCSELLFFFVFLIWTYLRGFKPEAYGTEKFMDYGFMTAMMRSEHMPPQDPWFAGQAINYYYVGQFLATYLTKLTGCTVNYGYNLMLMMLASFAFVLPYSIVYEVAATFGADFEKGKRPETLSKKETNKKYFGTQETRKKVPKLFYTISGLIAGTAVCLAGNLHYPIYAKIQPWLQKITGAEVTSYWFPNATRYIGYNPETNDKTIHEFPSYSFVLGDLHAHVINIMFVLTVLALLFAWLLDRKQKMEEIKQQMAIKESSYLSEAFHPVILLIGFFIGLFHTTNFWDFPIYFVIAGAVILFSNAVIYQFSKKTLLLTAIHAAIVLAISTLVCLPFTLSFNNISAGIAFTSARTPLYQLGVLWGLPVTIVVVYLVFCILKLKQQGIFKKNKGSRKEKAENPIEMIAFQPNKNRLFRLIEGLSIPDLFILILGLCAIGLVLIPEIIYVVDIYSGSYKRANTMFKLTYQAYILFGLCFGYILMKLIFYSKSVYRILGIVGLLVWMSTVPYVKTASDSWFGDVTKKENYKGIDAAAFIKEESLDDYKALQWLNDNVEGSAVVLEANGDSYTYYQRVSVITGLPTVLGWKTHEWLWRSDENDEIGDYPASVAEREDDVKAIYTSADEKEVRTLLKKYKVEYIYIGGCEREKFMEELNEELLKSLGKVVFEAGQTYIIQVQ